MQPIEMNVHDWFSISSKNAWFAKLYFEVMKLKYAITRKRIFG